MYNPGVHKNNQIIKQLPKGGRGEGFIVQCNGFRCMAYKDSRGKWRDFFSGDELVGEVTVVYAS